MTKDAICMEESFKASLKRKLLMICHILTENNLKISDWHWLQAIAWEESQQMDIKKTNIQPVRAIMIITKYLLFRHNHGIANRYPGHDQHLRTEANGANGMVMNQHGMDSTMRVQTQHTHGPIDHLEDTHRGEEFLKKEKGKKTQGEPFTMKGPR